MSKIEINSKENVNAIWLSTGFGKIRSRQNLRQSQALAEMFSSEN